MNFTTLNGNLYGQMIRRGAGNLKIHAEEINNLNVFPIPDGDTGSNMLLTMLGGVNAIDESINSLGTLASKISDGMLMGARGNSGVILSQFFAGLAIGFKDIDEADMHQVENAFQEGVKHAYEAVMTPTEGTILTVAKDSTNAACKANASNLLDFINAFLNEAEKSLERTPELLPVLKKAGVVDSGGAGLLYIIRGFRQILLGENEEEHPEISKAETSNLPNFSLDFNKFTENSVLEFGYCTELLVRLQNKKCDVENFDIDVVKKFLESIGNSVVIFKNGSILKLHVHTMEPYKVLQFLQQFGEYLTVKIENMSLQHNNLDENHASKRPVKKPAEHKRYGTVAVASGEGIQQMFLDHGVDQIVNGGQSMNPASEDFINAFDQINADTIFVFPNNSNVILAAKQAAKIYKKAEIIVIESHTIGEGYSAITMMDTTSNNTEEIIENFKFAMDGVSTYMVSLCVRDAEMDGIKLKNGDYMGFEGKSIKATASTRLETALATVKAMDFTDHEVCILIRGNDSINSEFEEIQKLIKTLHPQVEVYPVNGGQDIYSYIMIVE